MGISHASLAGALALAALLSVGCAKVDPKVELAKATALFEQDDSKAAVIHLKTALQQEPDLAPARFLLGVILLQEGSVSASQIELRKALELGQSEDDVVPHLAKAMLATGQASKLIGEWRDTRLTRPKDIASLQTTLANTYAALGKPDLAASHLDAALQAVPGFEPALLAQAQSLAAAGNFDAALALLDTIIAANAGNAEALKFKGDIQQFALRQVPESLASYQLAVKARPKYEPAQVAIVLAQLRLGEVAAAEEQLKTLSRMFPGKPNVKYLEALIAFQKGDFQHALEVTQAMLRTAPNQSRVLLLSAASEAELGALQRAKTLLNQAIQVEPGLRAAHQLLIAIQLQTGQNAEALATLNSMISRQMLGQDQYALAGQVYLFNGDIERAETYFKNALRLDPDDPRKRTAMAIAQMAAGRTATAFEELTAVAKATTRVEADLALITAHMRRGEFAGALAALGQLEKKQIDGAVVATLRGQILLAQHDRAGARKSFGRALEIQATHYAAVAHLAAMDMEDGKPDAARERFEGLLKVDQDNMRALLALAAMAKVHENQPERATTLLQRAVKAHPNQPAPRLRLIEQLLANKKTKEALSVAENSVAALPDSYDLLDALGRVQQVDGGHGQAVATYAKLIPMRPTSAHPYIRQAEAHVANSDPAQAVASLRKALDVEPNSAAALRGLVMMSLARKDLDGATEYAKHMQMQRPKEAVGYALAAEIAMAQKRPSAAISALREGLAKTDSALLAARLHATLTQAGQSKDAQALAAQWASAHPEQTDFTMYLAEVALKNEDFAAAEAAYAKVVRRVPDHALARNNLAWAIWQQGKAGAIEHAERAVQLEPNRTAFLDTLASILSSKGDLPRALAIQRKIVNSEPENTGYRLELAKTLLKAGETADARAQLQHLAKLGDKFAGQAEVAQLLSKL